MSKQIDQETELRPLSLTADEFRAEITRRLEGQDPTLAEKKLSKLARICPHTFGRHGAINTPEKFSEVLGALPSKSPLQIWNDGMPIRVGEITLDWPSLVKVLAPMRDVFARLLMAESGRDEVEAREIAGVVMLVQMDYILLKLEAAMSDSFILFLTETQRDGVDIFRALYGGQPLPYNSLIKELSKEFEQSLRRRSFKTLTPCSRRTGWLTWQEFEIAITAWPSDTLPPLGEFAASLPRYAAKTPPANPLERRKDRDRAKSAMKKELALLKAEGFCPETDWPKLFKGVRSGEYPRYDPLHVNVDVDAGDEAH
jgi:hypothetical protein